MDITLNERRPSSSSGSTRIPHPRAVTISTGHGDSASIDAASLSNSKPQYLQRDSDAPMVLHQNNYSQDVVEASLDVPDESSSHMWRTKIDALLLRNPRLHRLVMYVRGPSPKVELAPPGYIYQLPLPLSRGRRKALPIPRYESFWLRITRPLTSRLLLIFLTIAYIISFSFFVRAQWFLTPPESFVDCTSSYWLPKDGCGLDGSLCGPFTADDFVFRCPAGCSRAILANERAVGVEEVAYVPLIIGGGDANRTYRGDSWICPAAVHA
jgi:hypothetical protein